MEGTNIPLPPPQKNKKGKEKGASVNGNLIFISFLYFFPSLIIYLLNTFLSAVILTTAISSSDKMLHNVFVIVGLPVLNLWITDLCGGTHCTVVVFW